MSEQVESPQTLFTSDTLEDDQYRPLSPFALISGVAGVLSLLAVFHPLLWVFPALAVLCSLFTLSWIRRWNDRVTGRGVAVVALMVSCFMLVYAPVRVVSRETTLKRTAKAHSDEWLKLVQSGRLYEAHQLHMSPDQREHHGRSWEVVYAPPPPPTGTTGGPESGRPPQRELESMMATMMGPAADYDRFYKTEPLSQLVAHREDAEVQFKRFIRVRRSTQSQETVDLEYTLTVPSAEGRKVLPMFLHLTRTIYEPADAKWTIQRVDERFLSPE